MKKGENMKTKTIIFPCLLAFFIICSSVQCQAIDSNMLSNQARWEDATTVVCHENAAFQDVDCRYILEEETSSFYLNLSFTVDKDVVMPQEIIANLLIAGKKSYILELPSSVLEQKIDGIRTNNKITYDDYHRRLSYVIAVELPTRSSYSIAVIFRFDQEELRVQRAITFDLTPPTTIAVTKTTTHKATERETTQKVAKDTTTRATKGTNTTSRKTNSVGKNKDEKEKSTMASTAMLKETDGLVVPDGKTFFERMSRPGKATFFIAIALGIVALVVTAMALSNAKKAKKEDAIVTQDETQPKE